MKRERKRRMSTIQRVGESFSDGGEECKARRLCNRSRDRAMERAVSHPLKREKEKSRLQSRSQKKKEWLRNDNRGLWEDSGRAGGAIYATKAASSRRSPNRFRRRRRRIGRGLGREVLRRGRRVRGRRWRAGRGNRGRRLRWKSLLRNDGGCENRGPLWKCCRTRRCLHWRD